MQDVTPVFYTIAGAISNDGRGDPIGTCATTTLTLTGSTFSGSTTLTGANGAYSFPNVAPGTYYVTPFKTGCAYTPTSLLVDLSSDSLLNTFTAITSVAPPILTVGPGGLPGGTAGAAYSTQLTASGGTPPYTFQVFSGSLPAGIGLTSAGVVGGTPTQAVSTSFTVQAKDALGILGQLAYTLSIAGPNCTYNLSSSIADIPVVTGSGTLSVTTGPLCQWTATSPVSWLTITTGASSTGSGTVAFTAQTAPTTATRSAVLTIAGQSFTVNQAGAAFTLSGSITDLAGICSPGASVSVTGGGGTTQSNADRTYSFPSLAAGTYTLTPSKTGCTFTPESMTVTVAAVSPGNNFVGAASGTISLGPASLTSLMAHVAGAAQLTASGGTSPYSFNLISGNVPPGMSLASNGAITGTPTLEGDYIFTVQGTDAAQRTGQLNYTLTVLTNPCVNSVTLMTASLDQALGLPVFQESPVLSSTAQSRVARAGPTRRSGAVLAPLSSYDLNGDGVVIVVDIQTAIGAALAVSTCQ